MATRTTSTVFYAETGDADMDAAMARARDTFKYLWRELTWEYRRIIPGLELAVVKAGFSDADSGPDGVEHIWLNDIAFNGDEILATLLNQPNHVTSVKAGDRVTLSPDEIEDWMYVANGQVCGGFTIQAMRARMDPSERKKHDGAWGLEFGDPGHVEVVPDWTAKKPGVLGRFFGTKQPSRPRDPDAEHPMSENMAPQLAAAIAQNPDAFLRDADKDGLTMLHSFALGGSAASVRVLLEKGADRTLRTKSGKTALDFAERMKWPRVIELLRAAPR